MIGASNTTTIEVAGVKGMPLTIVGMRVERAPRILKTRFNTHPRRITSLNGGCVCTTPNNSTPFRRKRIEIRW
jgi:hypothetical protein